MEDHRGARVRGSSLEEVWWGSLTHPQWLRQRREFLKDVVWSSASVGTPLLCLSIWSEHKDTFLSHDSEDKGHWVTSKLTPDPCWFRGLSRVFTHRDTHIKTHKAPTDLTEKRHLPTQQIPFYLLRYVSSNLVKTVGLPLLLRLGISRESWVWWLCRIPPRCCRNIQAKTSRRTSFRHGAAHRDGACCLPSTTTEVAAPDQTLRGFTAAEMKNSWVMKR